MSRNDIERRLDRLATTAISEDVAGLTQASSGDAWLVTPTAVALLAAAAAFTAAAQAYLAAD
jgi:hypothetical protein